MTDEDGYVSPVDADLADARALSDQLRPGLFATPQSQIIDGLVAEIVRLRSNAIAPDEAFDIRNWAPADMPDTDPLAIKLYRISRNA